MEGEWIKYDSDALESAITLAMNANTSVSDIDVSQIKGLTTTSNPSIATELESAASDIETQITQMGTVEGSLRSIGGAFSEKTNDKNIFDGVKEEIIGEFKRIEINESGVKGYLYFPKDNISPEGMPLTVCIGGAADKYSNINRIINGGYSLNSAFFLPEYGCREDEADLQKAIDTIANKCNVDKERISLYGHSDGGLKAYKLVAANPNYYSCCAVYSADLGENGRNYLTREIKKGIAASTDTTIITYINTGKDSPKLEKEYEGLVEAGVSNIVAYCFNGAHKDALGLSSALFTDLANVRRGTVNLGGGKLILTNPNELAEISFFGRDNKLKRVNSYFAPVDSYYYRLS